MDHTDKYLSHYAETEASLAIELFAACQRPRYARAVVIPAFDETRGFVERLAAHPQITATLVIAVINRPCQKSPGSEGLRTQALWNHLIKDSTAIAERQHLSLRTYKTADQTFDLLLIDFCTGSRCLPHKRGVGLARKCGTDIAVAMIHNEQIASRWIYCTDADAWLPANYFSSRREEPDVAAIHCAFEHFNPGGLSAAQRLYEFGMQYFVCGLKWAGSPYAHYSLGSALIINSSHYAAVRGFPRRAAGEDFYVLNKLAKIGRVKYDPDITVRLEERESHRTPFGTGPAIRKIAQLEQPQTEPLFYHPLGFELLRVWLSASAMAIHHREHIVRCGSRQWLQEQWRHVPHGEVLRESLDAIGMLTFTDQAISRYRSDRQYLHQSKIHFDALKTLRLIHELRNRALGLVTAADAEQWLNRHKMPRFTAPSTGV